LVSQFLKWDTYPNLKAWDYISKFSNWDTYPILKNVKSKGFTIFKMGYVSQFENMGIYFQVFKLGYVSHFINCERALVSQFLNWDTYPNLKTWEKMYFQVFKLGPLMHNLETTMKS